MARKMLLAAIVIWLGGCGLRPRCKDSCHTKFLEGDERSNCLSQCDAYYELQERREKDEPPPATIPELVSP